MRFLIVLIILLLLIFHFWPEQPTPAVEETFIGPQIETLEKAERIEQQYMDALERADQRIEEQADGR